MAEHRGPALITGASALALAPDLFDGIYSGSKAYLVNLSHSLAELGADSHVYVQAALPGATRTEIWERGGKDAAARYRLADPVNVQA